MSTLNLVNRYSSTLASGYTSGGGSLSVLSASGLPSGTCFFHIIVKADGANTEEIFLVTSISGTTLTVTGAQAGTSASNHGAGAQILGSILTAEAIYQIRADASQVGVYASLPASGMKAGDQYHTTDSLYRFVYTGSVWQAFVGDLAVTLPPSASWTWDNQGSSAISFSKGAAFMSAATNAGDQIRAQYRTAPSTPYTITARFAGDFSGASGGALSGRRAGVGIAFSDSSGKYVVLQLLNDIIDGSWVIGTFRFASATSIFTSQYTSIQSASLIPMLARGYYHLQISDDGANLTFRLSCDGVNWRQYDQRARTDYLTSGPTRVAWFMFAASGAVYDISMYDWTQA